MPVVLRTRGYVFRFRAIDRNEPPHVHVNGNGGSAKVWLRPVRVAQQRGYSGRRIEEIRRIVQAHSADFEAAWFSFFAR
ncbi:MAG: DUF4160 domain-containing protein [Chloroflexi bacterium]|nr:MAG: DUF4160 domain-containing protein [Chloroflexota bacterium]TMC35658.1 MAG: DUF4160 domain-containing protein [Chloroflexota bacterium]TMC55596.1 MAG: DUF4160 domain-containing protein [Chloroflexota bacterium]TME40271.1 MAG: DUF4160 domain-containing protein [Chloroflexota bacterium]